MNETPHQLQSIIDKANQRLVRNCYNNQDRASFDPNTAKPLLSGTGLAVCLKQGYRAFKDYYQKAEDDLIAQLKPILEAPNRRVEIVFKSEGDFADYGRHHWSAFEVV